MCVCAHIYHIGRVVSVGRSLGVLHDIETISRPSCRRLVCRRHVVATQHNTTTLVCIMYMFCVPHSKHMYVGHSPVVASSDSAPLLHSRTLDQF